MAAGIIPIALTVGASLLQARQQVVAGKEQERQAKIQASQEELGAIQREADRKQRLARALASQTASAGAGGIAAFEGSPLTVLQESITTEETATERDVFQSRLSALTTRARGKIARQRATQGAVIGLIGSLSKVAPTIPSFGGSEGKKE